MIRVRNCAICKAELPHDCEHFPFCSDRCRQVDFFRWFEGKYAIVEPLDEESDLDGLIEDEDV